MSLRWIVLSVVPLFCNAAADMKLNLLPQDVAKERGAQCLDHSPAGYYTREQDPKKWVIFLEGGGLCVELVDCLARSRTYWGSSKHLDPAKPPEGLMTASLSSLNPFANYSHVWVPYCSGDTWAGKSPKAHRNLLGLQMSGHLILDTLIDYLLNTTAMSSASEVIFSGTSAGGIGVYHHVDWLADKLSSFAASRKLQPPRVVGFPIEGMFFPYGWPVMYAQFALGSIEPLANFASKYLALVQEPWFPPACAQASKTEKFDLRECFDVYKLLSYIKTPLFIASNRFDKLEIQTIGLCFECKPTDAVDGLHGRYIRLYGARLNHTVTELARSRPQHGWFVPSVFHHDENYHKYLEHSEKSIAGVSLRKAIEMWLDKQKVVLIEPTCQEDGPCDGDGLESVALAAAPPSKLLDPSIVV